MGGRVTADKPLLPVYKFPVTGCPGGYDEFVAHANSVAASCQIHWKHFRYFSWLNSVNFWNNQQTACYIFESTRSTSQFVLFYSEIPLSRTCQNGKIGQRQCRMAQPQPLRQEETAPVQVFHDSFFENFSSSPKITIQS